MFDFYGYGYDMQLIDFTHIGELRSLIKPYTRFYVTRAKKTLGLVLPPCWRILFSGGRSFELEEERKDQIGGQ